MGYFSNGTEGICYQERWCFRCIHWVDEPETIDEDCPVWQAHLGLNYKEHDKPESILHMLIPRDENGGNKKCRMFHERVVGRRATDRRMRDD